MYFDFDSFPQNHSESIGMHIEKLLKKIKKLSVSAKNSFCFTL